MTEEIINQNIEITESGSSLYNIDYILTKISEMQSQTDYITEALAKLSEMGDGDSGDSGGPGNILGQAKANAIGDIVKCRETTNQQILRLYEKMYDDLFPKKAEEYSEAVKWNTIAKISEMGLSDGGLDTIRQMLRENK